MSSYHFQKNQITGAANEKNPQNGTRHSKSIMAQFLQHYSVEFKVVLYKNRLAENKLFFMGWQHTGT